MKKGLIIVAVIIIAALVLIFSNKASSPKPQGTSQQEQTKTENVKTETQKAAGIENVCKYFPKELVEKTIGRPIVKVEDGTLVDPTCNYYTSYSEKYEHTPYGDHPGGPKVVVVYDTKDFAKDRISNEKSGNKYETDSSINMNNFVMKNNVNKIWQVALDYGNEKYIRIKAIDNAVTGEELVKIAAAFASK
jgi:hypothetical protein